MLIWRDNRSLLKIKSNVLIMMLLIFLFESWKCVVAFINSESINSYLKDVIIFMGVVITTAYFMERDFKDFLWSTSLLMDLLVCINFFSFLFIPKGFGTDATGNIIYFWNTSKHIISLYIVAFTLNIFTSICVYKKNKIVYMLLNLLIIVDLLLEWPGTALIGMGLYLILILGLIFTKKEKKAIFYNPWLYFFVGISVNIAIVFFRVQDIFSYLIVDVLGKNLTFTGRVYIWDISLKLIKEKWIIGYGSSDLITYKGYSLMAHNQFLDILVQAGVVGLILFLLYLTRIVKQLYSNRKKKTAKFIMGIMFAYLIMMVTERVSPFEPLYMIFTMAFFLDNIEREFYVESVFRGGKIRWQV